MAVRGRDENSVGGDIMKRCPKCGEWLADSVKICPVCGYKFENTSLEGRIEIGKEGESIPLNNGGNLRILERIKLNEYPPFLEGDVPVLDIVIKNESKEPIVLNITGEILGYAEKDEKTATLNPGEYYEYEYYPTFKKSKFKELKSYGESTLKYTISTSFNNFKSYIRTYKVIILSYRDILWEVGAKYIVKWITPRDEIIEKDLLNLAMKEQEKLDPNRKGAITGEQEGFKGIVLQMEAIYNALKGMGIRYKSTPVSILKGYQRIRLPREVIEEKGGNCIELAVTYASALEASELVPVIFLTPNHAFPGVYISQKTMMGGISNLESLGSSGYKNHIYNYEDILKKYGISDVLKEDDMRKEKRKDIDFENKLKVIEDSLYRVSGGYLLPVESTSIPYADFVSAVQSIYKKEHNGTSTIEEVEEIVVVPEARESLGLNALPYENVVLKSKNKKYFHRW